MNIQGTNVPQAFEDRVRELKRHGSLVFLAMPEMQPDLGEPIETDTLQSYNCNNCYDTGQVQLQFATGGPYATPTSPGAKTAIINHAGSYYAVKTEIYFCPDCQIRRHS